MPTAAIAQGGGGVAEVGFERGGPGGEDPSEGLVAIFGAGRDVEGGVPRCFGDVCKADSPAMKAA